ncbi:MAG: tryptophan-rich sensory protein, partial [Clostridia bacterium]|nr:tryptophan-rich sensory protein [Clostridia bacterium]
MQSKTKPYVYSIVLTLAVGGLSALLTAGNMNIYEKVKMPPLSPPSWLFPVVWTILYVL